MKPISEIDRGPFGRVFTAIDELDGTELVVVRTDESLDADDEQASLTRLCEETRRLTKAHGDHLVRVRSIDNGDRSIEVVFEAPRGITLHQYLEGPPRPRSEVIEVSRSLIAAVAEAHALDLAHRALNAHDVYVSDDHRVELTGFGLTRTTLRPAEASAPEVMTGHPADLATDQFQLGRLLARLAERVEPPLAISGVCERATASDPLRRYRDVFDLAAAYDEALALSEIAGSREPEALVPPSVSPSRRFPRARLWLALLAAATAAVALITFVGFDAGGGSIDTTTPPAVSEVTGAELFDQAHALIAADELERAGEVLESALAAGDLIEPAAVHATLGTGRLKLGEFDAAAEHLEAAVALEPRAERYYLLALALASAGRTADMRAAIAAGLEIDPDNPDLLEARTRLGG